MYAFKKRWMCVVTMPDGSTGYVVGYITRSIGKDIKMQENAATTKVPYISKISQTSVAIRKIQSLFPLASICNLNEERKLYFLKLYVRLHIQNKMDRQIDFPDVWLLPRVDGSHVLFLQLCEAVRSSSGLLVVIPGVVPPWFLEHHSHLRLVDGDQVPKDEKAFSWGHLVLYSANCERLEQ